MCLQLGDFLSQFVTIRSHYIRKESRTSAEQRLLFVGSTLEIDPLELELELETDHVETTEEPWEWVHTSQMRITKK
jgi:hypothetical protein